MFLIVQYVMLCDTVGVAVKAESCSGREDSLEAVTPERSLPLDEAYSDADPEGEEPEPEEEEEARTDESVRESTKERSQERRGKRNLEQVESQENKIIMHL